MMRAPHRRPGPRRWLRLPRRTARLRLTVLYAAAFLACGMAVLAVVTYLVFEHTAQPPPLSRLDSFPSEQLHARAPIADVRRAGLDDIVRLPIAVPVADVHQSGRYDVLNLRFPIASAQRLAKPPVITAAEQAALLAKTQVQVSYARQQILVISALALAATAAVAAAIGWIIAGRVLRPLSAITAAARGAAASNLHERLALHGPDDELKELADTLDNLFARLEASFDAQRRFAASASHELRTPLTRERTLLQVTLADPASTISTWQAVSRELLASNAEQERLIEALLVLAGSEAGSGEHQSLDLAAITGAALAAAHPAISQRGLRVQADLQAATLDGDPLLIQQLVSNLIGNAVQHNLPGGDIQVATGTTSAGAVVSVSNSGQAIPSADVDRLFQPFQRLGPRPARAAGGHGLGLSIVRAIANAHDATITAQPRPGGGLAIDVGFPRHQAAAADEARRPA